MQTEDLPPTQYLIMEVLAARCRKTIGWPKQTDLNASTTAAWNSKWNTARH